MDVLMWEVKVGDAAVFVTILPYPPPTLGDLSPVTHP